MNRLFTTFAALFLSVGLVAPGQAVQAEDGPPARPDTSDTPVVAIDDADDETNADATTTDAESAPQDDEPTLDVNFSGSISFGVLFRDYGAGENGNFEDQADNVRQDGGFTFDTFRIGGNGSYGDVIFDLEWAFYPESFGGNYIHHGWAGYEFSDTRKIQVGVHQVPFGIQPFASSSWFFNFGYYVGLEDDYDAGIKAVYQPGNWDLQGGYYMNAEQTDFFGGSNAGRYSYDVIPRGGGPGLAAPRNISEQNQLNAKVAYAFDHGDLGFTKVGVSGQRGQLLNEVTGETDWHAAYAVHVQGRYEGFGAKLEFMQQDQNPPLSTDQRSTFGQNFPGAAFAADDFVVMGAYGSPNRVASEISVVSSSLSYRIPVDLGAVSQFKPYYDFSLVSKDVDAFNDNVSHILGFTTAAGPLFVYTDLIFSKGHPFNQPFDETFQSALAEQNDNEWRTALNINIGLYF